MKEMLFVLKKLVVDTFLQSHQIIKDFVIWSIELLKDNDMLVALLFGLLNDIVYVDVARFIALEEVLLGMLDNAVGT